jgi:hypothetical protein
VPIDDKDRSKTILTNADNLLTLTEKTEQAIQGLEAAGDPVQPALAAILVRLFATVRSLREQLHLIESERPDTRSRS